MTTQDHQTLTDSYDESQTPVAETPPVSEPTAAPGSPTVEQQQVQSPPADPSTASAGSAPTDETPAVPAEHSSSRPESSTKEVLFADDELADLRARWAALQAGFVDDPKECVHKADGLVSDVVEQLTTGFADARTRLEEQWARCEEVSTEDLRVALMHYRGFFERLLAV